MIPELDAVTGHIPPGRYRTDLDEVRRRLVDSPEFAGSGTRTTLWKGLEAYLVAWASVEITTATPEIVRALWLAGSFVSCEPEPGDIDVSPILDATKINAIRGREGSGLAKRLFTHRERLRSEYHLDVFPILWVPAPSVFRPPGDPLQRDYLFSRGAMDDWWQRIRPTGPKCPPTPEGCGPSRGYLEVIV